MATTAINYNEKQLRLAKSIGFHTGVRVGTAVFLLSVTPPIIKHTLRNEKTSVLAVMGAGIIAGKMRTEQLLRKKPKTQT